MLMSTFSQVLSTALTPITLISGVGIMMMSMTARYNHATNRIRQLMRERDLVKGRSREDVDQEIDLIFHRAALLRQGSLCLAVSAVCTAIQVAITVFQSFIIDGFEMINGGLLMMSIGCIIAASLLFAMEIRISLHALVSSLTTCRPYQTAKAQTVNLKFVTRRLYRQVNLSGKASLYRYASYKNDQIHWLTELMSSLGIF